MGHIVPLISFLGRSYSKPAASNACWRYDLIRWWAELSDFCRIRPYLNTDPVVELLTHYIGLYDLNRKWSCLCCFSNLFENSLNVQCIHDISHLLWIFDENTKYGKKIWSHHGCRLISFSKAPVKPIVRPLSKTIAYKLSLASKTNGQVKK